MKKQISAVEWLVEQLKTMDTKSFNRLIQIEMSRENFEECFEQAKEMEKEQIINAYTADCDTLGHTNSFNVAAEQYYNETFKSE